jgi:hypothetical protein
VACSRGGQKISHLFFADDSLLFCNATIEECGVLMEKLKLYEKASSQSINTEKTSLFFSHIQGRLNGWKLKIFWGFRRLESMRNI